MEYFKIALLVIIVLVIIIKTLKLNQFLWIKASSPKKGRLYEFQKDVTNEYGFFIDVETKKEYLFKTGDVTFFEKDRFYEYDPKNIIVNFEYLGSPDVYEQTWKRVGHP